jgi:hypothetical protein
MPVSVDAEEPADVCRVGEQLRRRSRVDDATGIEHDDVPSEALHHREVLLDEHDRHELGGTLECGRHLRHEERRQTFCRLVDKQDLVAVEERARDRDHLLLTARKRSGALLAFDTPERVMADETVQTAYLGEPL